MAFVDTPALLAGKQRELQQRDELHLEIARRIFLEEGYHGLTISRLAKTTGFSRPTLYERFGSKEGLLVELGLQCHRQWVAFLRQASAFPGRTRERIVAFAEVIRHYAERYADDLHILSVSRTDLVLKRATPDQQREYAALDGQIFGLVQNVVDDAIRLGDLTCPEGTSAQVLTLTLMALTDGLALAMRGSVPLNQLELADPFSGIIRSIHVLLDGYGWRPLTSEWDYADTERRVKATIITAIEREESD